MPKEITGRALKDRLSAGEPTLLLDVRQPWEFARAKLAGSVLIPLGELAHRTDELAPPGGALVVTVCHHGVRSLTAAAILEAQGLGPVVSLAGGIDAWSRDIDPDVPRY
jgi:rhodanese-related sulfurtransferase